MIYEFISGYCKPVFVQNVITDYHFYIGLNNLDFMWYCIFVL